MGDFQLFLAPLVLVSYGGFSAISSTPCSSWTYLVWLPWQHNFPFLHWHTCLVDACSLLCTVWHWYYPISWYYPSTLLQDHLCGGPGEDWACCQFSQPEVGMVHMVHIRAPQLWLVQIHEGPECWHLIGATAYCQSVAVEWLYNRMYLLWQWRGW